MSNQEPSKDYPVSKEIYQRKEAQRRNEAHRPISEKMATVVRLRDFQRQLKDIRQANRAKRALSKSR